MTSTSVLDSPHARRALHRRTLAVVMASQVFSGAGLAAGVTVGALLAEDMLDTTSLSGLPVALFTFGSAGAALTVGRISQRLGRRAGRGARRGRGRPGRRARQHPAVAAVAAGLRGRDRHQPAGPATPAPTSPSLIGAAGRSAPSWSGTTLGAVAGPNLVATTGDLAGASRRSPDRSPWRAWPTASPA